jgi:hypothetical protein
MCLPECQKVKVNENGALFFSEQGPGSMRAPLLISLVAGLIIGVLAQRTRFCTMGSIRDVVLMGDTHLISGVGALVVTDRNVHRQLEVINL